MSENKLATAPTAMQSSFCTKSNPSAPSTTYTTNSPEQSLPFRNLRTTFINAATPHQPISVLQLGKVVADQYTVSPDTFVPAFSEYQDQHAMGAVRKALKEGMDQISCDYVDLHETVMEIAKHDLNCIVRQDYLWTNFDRKMFAHNREIMRNPPSMWMAAATLEDNSMVTNVYGLFDLPPKVLAKVDGLDIIDGGAFIGDTIPVFRKNFPQSVVYCFEPESSNFNTMHHLWKKEIESNVVKPVKMGLGNQPQTMTLNKITDAVDSMATVTDIYGIIHDAEQISVTTLDDFVKKHQLKVGLLKLDIEGFEPEALQGAINTIKEQKPLLVIAIYHTPEEFYELKPYLQSLNLGYKFAIRRSSFVQPQTELVLIAYQEL